MFARYIEIVQLLFLYCIVQNYALCDAGSTPTQLAESEISGETAGLAENDSETTEAKYASVLRWLNIKRALYYAKLANRHFLSYQKDLEKSVLEKEADNSGRKDRETRDTGNKENIDVCDIKFDWKRDNRRATDERDQSLKKKICQNFQTVINLFLDLSLLVIHPFKKLGETIVQTTKSYVDKLTGLFNQVNKLEFTDERFTSTESSNRSIISPIVKQSESANNYHQTVESRMPEIHNDSVK